MTWAIIRRVAVLLVALFSCFVAVQGEETRPDALILTSYRADYPGLSQFKLAETNINSWIERVMFEAMEEDTVKVTLFFRENTDMELRKFVEEGHWTANFFTLRFGEELLFSTETAIKWPKKTDVNQYEWPKNIVTNLSLKKSQDLIAILVTITESQATTEVTSE
jgi:hypothetical protein